MVKSENKKKLQRDSFPSQWRRRVNLNETVARARPSRIKARKPSAPFIEADDDGKQRNLRSW